MIAVLPILLVDEVQDRLLAFLKALLAQAMRWFTVLHAWLDRVGKSSAPAVLQLVALLLCVPVFKLGNACFELAYSINQRRMLRLSVECGGLGGYENRVEFEDLSLDGLTVAQRYCSLARYRRPS